MSTLQSQLRLSLIDQISGAAKRIQASLQGVGRSAAGVRGGGFGSAIAASADRATRNVVALQAKIVAATAAIYGFSRAAKGIVNPAASFETVLLDIAQKADLSDNSMAQLGMRIRAMARDLGRGAGDVAKGMDTLLGMGMREGDAIGVLPAIAKAASAYNAEMTDLAKASMAVMDNLKVRVDQVPAAIDAMSRAGKEGSVELSDLARYMGSLAALGGTLRLKGVEGVTEISAALEVIRKSSGTSEEAATRLSDVFGKMTSPESVKKFGKLGVDIKKNLATAQKAAEKAGKPFSAIEFIVENLQKATKGDKGKIGDIFADKEARLGAIALVDHFKEFQRIYAAALNSKGEVDRDYLRRAKTFQDTLRRFQGAAEELAIAIGERVLPTLTRFSAAFTNILNTMDGRVTVFDKFGKAIAGFLNGLGLTDGSTFAAALKSLAETVFGTVERFEADTDRLGQIFASWKSFGEGLKAFAEGVSSALSAIASFVGLDTGALLSFLGTLVSYGAGLAVTAAALGMVAKSMMAVGRAAMFLSGASTAIGIVKALAGIGAGTAAAGGAGAGAAGGGLLGWLAGARKWAGPIGVGLAGKAAIDTASDVRKRMADGTAKHGLHSPAGDDGDAKLADYRREIAEIEGTLDRLREKSRDPDTFAIANQAQIRRLEELKIAQQNLSEELAKRQPAATAETPPRVWSPKPAAPAPTLAPLPPSRPPELSKPKVDSSDLSAAADKATEAKEAVEGLNTSVTPKVDTGSLREALSYAQALNAELRKTPGLVVGASSSTGRGRSEVAQATAALSRSRQTNNQDRPYA